jgi:hypothetical protein
VTQRWGGLSGTWPFRVHNHPYRVYPVRTWSTEVRERMRGVMVHRRSRLGYAHPGDQAYSTRGVPGDIVGIDLAGRDRLGGAG